MADHRGMADDNRDPFTTAPEAQAVGVGDGATGGGVAGAAVGTAVGDPAGAVIDAAVGAVAGELAALLEAVDPTAEDAYWREHYITTPYHVAGEAYDVYQPAYRHGWESYTRYNGPNPNRSFDAMEADLERDWENTSHAKRLSWAKARDAARDAWHRIEQAHPGDADGDGY